MVRDAGEGRLNFGNFAYISGCIYLASISNITARSKAGTDASDWNWCLVVLAGAAIVGIGVTQLRAPLGAKTATDGIPAITAPVNLSEFEWGFERHPSYPYIGMMGGKEHDPPVVFQFQAQGHNRTKDPIANARAYIRSDRTGREYAAFFNIGGKFLKSDEINPIPVDAIIDIHAHFMPERKPISIRQFLDEISPLTFFFDYDGKQYRKSFTQTEIETPIRRSEQELRPQSPPPQMTVKTEAKPNPSVKTEPSQRPILSVMLLH